MRCWIMGACEEFKERARRTSSACVTIAVSGLVEGSIMTERRPKDKKGEEKNV